MCKVHQKIQILATSVWHEAMPSVVKLLSHLVIFVFAAVCVAVMLVTTYGLLKLCDLLFANNYVNAACVIGEVLLFLYLMRFTQGKTIVPYTQ